MEIQNQVSRILRDNLARLRDVLDDAVSQGIGSRGQVADRVCEAFRFPRRAGPVAARELQPGVVRLGGGRSRLAACGSAGSRGWGPGAGACAPGGLGRGRAGHGRRGCGSDPGAGGDRRAAAGLEHADGLRAPPGGRSVRGPATAVSGGFGAWLAGRRRVCGICAAAAVPRRLGRVERYGPARPSAPGAGTVPAAGAPRDCVCRNLASYVLGRVVRAVGDDCERLYGYRPWLLETFVDETEQTGASVRAANWIRVGETCGRGRGDRTHAAAETRKAVYMYALAPAWRARLAAPAAGIAPLAAGDGARRGVVGGSRVRRGAAGRRAAERASGAERAANGRVSDARHHRRCPGRARPW